MHATKMLAKQISVYRIIWMNKTFLKNISTAFRSAGWLMIGTGLMIWIFNRMSTLADSFSQYATGSLIVGGCFVLIDFLMSYLLSKKT
jgi:hypothetical protein